MAETSKFAQFITDRKLDPRRILAVSHRLEKLNAEDRLIRLNKRRGRKAEASDQTAKETRKPHSGRPVTRRAFDAAFGGADVSGPTKTRILRAINHLLELKKEEKVDVRALF